MRLHRVRLFKVPWWMVLAVAFAALVVGILAWEARARRDGWYSEWLRADRMERFCLARVRQTQRAVDPSVDPSEVTSSETTRGKLIVSRAEWIEHHMDGAKWYASRKLEAERSLRRLGYDPPIPPIPLDDDDLIP